jgi:hypothetical protein
MEKALSAAQKPAATSHDKPDLPRETSPKTQKESSSSNPPTLDFCLSLTPYQTSDNSWKDPNLIRDRYDGMHMLRHISPFTKHDNATASLHRLCELICAASPNQIKLETVYFWCHSSWTL